MWILNTFFFTKIFFGSRDKIQSSFTYAVECCNLVITFAQRKMCLENKEVISVSVPGVAQEAFTNETLPPEMSRVDTFC